MTLPNNTPVDITALAKDLRLGNRAALARAITLIESRRGDHQAAARDLVQALLRTVKSCGPDISTLVSSLRRRSRPYRARTSHIRRRR